MAGNTAFVIFSRAGYEELISDCGVLPGRIFSVDGVFTSKEINELRLHGVDLRIMEKVDGKTGIEAALTAVRTNFGFSSGLRRVFVEADIS